VQVQIAFSEILVLAKLMNEIGADNITPESMSAALQAFKGPVPMGPPAVECGKYPAAPASCNDLTNFFQYDGNFQFTQLAEWLPPPEGFTF
jgi:branched-chain amino acid transport system substrate-binding protein